MSLQQVWIIVGVVFYMAIMLGIGFWASRKVKDTADYIIAGQRLSWGLSIGTIFATWFGAETCMGSATTAYSKGILGVIADPFGAGLCLIISGVFFAGHFYKLKIKTVIDFFELRFSKRVGMLVSLFYVPVYIGWIGAQMLAFGTVLHALTGLGIEPAIFISALVVIIYTYSGGMWADAVTDFVQMGFIIVCFGIVVYNISSTNGGLINIIQQIPKEKLHFYPHTTSGLEWMKYIEAWIIVGFGSLGGQDLVSRIMSAKNVTVARWSSVIAGILYWTVGLLPVMLGIVGFILLPNYTGESILIDLSIQYLPLPLVALMVGGLLSAIMSSVDTAMLAPASIIGNNVVPFFVKDVDDKTKLFWCKIMVPILGIVSLFMALYFQNIYELCLESWTVLLTSFTAPLAFGLFWKRTTSAGVIAGAVGGFIAWIAGGLLFPAEYPTKLLGFVVSVTLVFLISLITNDRQGNSPEGVSVPVTEG